MMNLPTATLLIVEDFQDSRELYRNCLLTDANYTYEFLEAESMTAGLELCRTRFSGGEATPTIDAILLDYKLPDGDGLKFLETLSARDNGSSPPVVMMTGHGDESIAVSAMKLGARDYLAKHKFTPERLVSTMHSVIDNARLQRQLQQSQYLLQLSIDTMLDCFGIYAAIRDETGQMIDFRFEYLNAAALESQRMTAADIGRGMCEVFPASCETELFAKYCRVIETGIPLIEDDSIYTNVLETQQLTKIYDTRISKLNDGFVATWRDVTVERQAERDRDRFFNLYLDLLAIGNFDGYFISLNPAFEQTLGFTTAELMATPFLDFVHPDDREHTIAGAAGLSEGQIVVNFENRYRCKDGSYRWLSWSAMRHTERNLWYAVGRDITERKHTQTALEHRIQELDSFVYAVSHDLKAPLRAIANLSRWIEEDLEGSLTIANREQMTLLRSRVERMSATIDELLDYARTGQKDVVNESVVVAQLLAEVIDSLSPPPTFCIDIAPMPTVSANRLLLFQVFVNLIDNAINHHDRSDGSIHISVRECSDCYEFAVSDDGAGIAPEQHERVFRIFQAVNPQNRADSTGIGLAIVKKIVETQGGTIWLESQIGKGTTFYFTWLKRSSPTEHQQH
jgi:PAS domain S-box-containing protein